MHAYIAGPMFNEGEDWWLGKIDKRIRKAGLTSYLNTRDAMALANADDVLPIFKSDVREIMRADVVVANLNGVAVGSGTAWEIGWAWSQGKHLVGVYTDFRLHYKWQTVNLMIQCSLDKIVRSLDELEEYLKMYKQNSEGYPAGGQPIGDRASPGGRFSADSAASAQHASAPFFGGSPPPPAGAGRLRRASNLPPDGSADGN